MRKRLIALGIGLALTLGAVGTISFPFVAQAVGRAETQGSTLS